MPFMKGQSGNPSGKPKLTKDGRSVAEMARDFTDKALNTLVDIMEDDQLPAAARVSACGHILDRGWGKPTQPIDAGERMADLAGLIAAARGRLNAD